MVSPQRRRAFRLPETRRQAKPAVAPHRPENAWYPRSRRAERTSSRDGSGSVREVSIVGDTLVLHCGGLPAAARKSLREATEQLAAAAREAGLPGDVRVDDDGPEGGKQEQGLRARVEADEGVRRVLEVFGGRLNSVEEKP